MRLWSKQKKEEKAKEQIWDVSSELVAFKEQLEVRYEEEKAKLEVQRREAEEKLKLMSDETIKKSLNEWQKMEQKLEEELQRYKLEVEEKIRKEMNNIDKRSLMYEIGELALKELVGKDVEVVT